MQATGARPNATATPASETFDALIEAQRRAVFSVCYRVLGDYHAAEDATQETFVAAWRWQDRVQQRGAPWLVHVALNKCRDELRRRARRPSQTLEAKSLAERLASEAPGPEALSLPHDQRHMLQRALGHLPDEQRVSLMLVDIEGLSYSEVAALTHVSSGTVKSSIHRGRLALRRLLTTSPASRV